MYALTLVLPLFCIIALGWVLRKSGFLQESAFSVLNRVLSRVVLPVMLFNSTRNISFSQVGNSTLLFLAALVITLIVAWGAAFLMKPFSRGAFIQCSFRGNLIYVGLPVIQLIAPEPVVSLAVAVMAIAFIVHVALSILVLEPYNPQREKLDIWGSFKKIIFQPLILSVAAGMLVSAVNFEAPQILSDAVIMLSRAGLPMALLVIGGDLTFKGVRFNLLPTLGAAGLKLVFMPWVALMLIGTFSGLDPDAAKVIVLMAASPTAVISQAFADAYNSNRQLAASSVAMSTLISLVTFPLWVEYLGI